MKYCLLALSSLLIIASCKKVETPLSKQEKLRAANWVIDTATITYLAASGADSETKGVWPEQVQDGKTVYPRPTCLNDDYFKFLDGTVGTHVTGPDHCNASETDQIDFTWGIFQADKKMYIYGMYAIFGQDVNADLKDFQDDKFTIEYEVPYKVVTGTPPVTTTYKKRISYRFKKK